MIFNEEQLRVAANLRQFYEAWLQSRRTELAFGGYLGWKTVAGRQYLYRTDKRGLGTSLGPRNAEGEALIAQQRSERNAARAARRGAIQQLKVSAALYRALRIPAIASAAARILREADLRGALGTDLLVVGTSAMAAYELEAGSRFALGLDATEDFDLAWAAVKVESLALAKSPRAPLLALLKAVDPTYVVNTERTFQARNADAFEVEVLLAPSLASTYPPTEPLRPVELPEQEWLLNGRRVDQVVCGRDGTVARIVAPDPRWFALHKCWLADKPTRNVLKATKDRKQGHALLAAISARMPHFPLDSAFREAVPSPLLPYLPH